MRKNIVITLVFATLLIGVLLTGCGHKDSTVAYQPVFAADTSENKMLVWGFPSFSYCENAEQIVKYLNKRLSGAHIVVKACVNWDEYVSFLNQNKFDITLVNGLEALEATNNGYTIFGKIKDDSQYVGVIFTRKNAGITKVSDLKGRRIALAPSNMIPGTMMPLYYLYEHGLDVNRDIEKVDVSSFESAIIAAYLGKCDAGLCLKRNWNVYVRDHPEVLEKVELTWETPQLINNALLAKNATNAKVTSQLKSLLFQMHTSPEGRAALKMLDISGFEKANAETYTPVLDFKRKYEAAIQ